MFKSSLRGSYECPPCRVTFVLSMCMTLLLNAELIQKQSWLLFIESSDTLQEYLSIIKKCFEELGLEVRKFAPESLLALCSIAMCFPSLVLCSPFVPNPCFVLSHQHLSMYHHYLWACLHLFISLPISDFHIHSFTPHPFLC